MTTTTPIMTASGSVQFRHYMVTVHAIERYIERIGGDVGNLILDLKTHGYLMSARKAFPALCAPQSHAANVKVDTGSGMTRLFSDKTQGAPACHCDDVICRGEVMHKAFEIWVRQRYGSRYDLTRDCDGFTVGKW